ncbi:MAG TPA: outer membrane protein assembly factor BamA [Bacteroidia bacterium]|nr:outer membrane protein assembly factor BamA [Bacteroidia bacterium]
MNPTNQQINKSIIQQLGKRIAFLFLFIVASLNATAQTQIGGDNIEFDYTHPKDYVIGGIVVTGTKFLDQNVLLSISGLSIGDTIAVPGEKITKALDNLWKQGLFSDVKIAAQKIVDDKIFLEYVLQEKPRLSKFSFKGDVKKGDAEKIRETIRLERDKVITDYLITNTKNIVTEYYVDKGFLDVSVKIEQVADTAYQNKNIIYITVDKKDKIKISNIIFHGNKEITSGKLKRAMKDTKEKRLWKIFTSSKFIQSNYEQDKKSVIEKYIDKGFRDAHLVRDTIYKVGRGRVNIEITIDEGHKYYFRNITWLGNTKHTTLELNQILGIKKGDVFEQAVLDDRLYMNPSGRDVTSLYMDDGYLFFQLNPVEVTVENDSIDLEMRISEGKQATVNKVSVTGNTKTHDHVIMREVRTKPGKLFSRSDIIRTQRELAQLGYFNPEKLSLNTTPNPAEGTVDIEYIVEEKPSDQIELSGGYGANQLVGTLGVSFNNFSLRNFFKKGAWTPLPSGDGQRLSLRAQTNGKYYQSYNISFTEPWVGGKKPNSLSTTAFHSVQSNGRSSEDPLLESIKIYGGSVGFGKRLKVPDDYFTLYIEGSYQYYILQNFSSTFLFSDGTSNNFSVASTFSRNSIDQPIYPRSGSQISLSGQFTPPYSLTFLKDTDFKTAEDNVKYKWIEYHKWKFSSSWFTKIAGDLVLNAKFSYGFLGNYNNDIGDSPFERFYLGGSGLSGYALDGREIIALRGYDDNTLTPRNSRGSYTGGTIFEKYTLEMRYPISLNPQATIYMLVFAEGGDSYLKFRDFNPFSFHRSAGFGIRVFLPVFGMLGLDWGYGFDDITNSPDAGGGQFHFSIGQQF